MIFHQSKTNTLAVSPRILTTICIQEYLIKYNKENKTMLVAFMYLLVSECQNKNYNVI